MRNRMLTVLCIALVCTLGCFAIAQAEWVAANNATPATPETNLISHTSAATVLDLTVHGFYVEEVVEAGDLYHLLSFGDNAKLRVVGKPELPVMTALVGIPDRSDLRVTVEVLESITLSSYNVWPAQELTKDGEEDPPFTLDKGFYAQNTVYPARAAVVSEPQIWRDVRLTRLEVHPITCNPATGELTVATRMRVTIDYFGYNATREFTHERKPITYPFQRLYGAAIINFDHLGYPLDHGGTDDPGTNFLVVCKDEALPYIQELVDFRHAQGYEVEVRTIAPDFDSPEEIKAYISQLYNLYGLEYVLFVGDAYYSGGPAAVDVPMYYWVDSYSDSWYTMMDGAGDYLADLAIGRIVYDGATDLTHQLDKIMAYLTAPEVSNWAEHTLLVAHSEQYPLKYTQCKEEIRTYPYSVQVPIFGTAYGGAGATNQDVINYLNTYSSGILNYRGHGSQTAWIGWSPSGSFTATEVYQLTNFDRYFVHYDVCCDNMDFPGYNGDCLAESFMKAPAAAIAINGAIIPSYTIPNHDYDKEFYKAIYDLEINHIGYASNFANITVYNVHGAIGQSNIRTYLWLGDACTDAWTNTMQTLAVTHPSVMLIGTSTLTINVGFEGALVCAQNDEAYAVGYTDASGSITLEFTPGPILPGDLTITVSAHNYLTYQSEIPIIPPSGPYVVYNAYEINDAVVGNNNGQWDFGETVDLSVEVKNVGIEPALATDVSIVTDDPLVTVIDGFEYYGDLGAGDSLSMPDGFRVEVDPVVEDQHMVAYTLTASSGVSTWESYFNMTVNAPIIAPAGLTILDPGGNNNGAIDPGETVDFILTLSNDGHSDAENVMANLSVNNPDLTLSGNPGTYGNLAVSGSADYTWIVVADAGMASGTIVTFTLDITANGGYAISEQFDLLVGDERNLPTGPDAYGYLAWDNMDGGESIPYDWIEIAPAAGGSGTVTAVTGDDQTMTFSLPFTFRYYGQDFTQISICSNGWMAMGSTTTSDYSNSGIPNSDGPPSMIAPFWDDLYPVGGETQICTYRDDVNHTYIIEWYNIGHYSATSTRETFEVILHDPAYWPTTTGDGIILCQYYLVSNASSVTFGIENQAETDGIQYGFDGNYDVHAWEVEEGRSITYTTNISGTPDVVVTLTPYGTPIQIPAVGGSFDYNIMVENIGSSPVTGQVWCDAIIPGGSVVGPLLGPATVANLPPGFVGDRDRTQEVPGAAPGGNYTYNCYIGAYPSTIWSQDSFNFEKLVTGDGAVIEGWNNYGESFDEWFGTGTDDTVIPDVYSLSQNYPNPFNPLTTISFGLPEAGYVKLAVYDLLGRQVALLVNGQREAGMHEVGYDASQLASGLYIYRIEAGDFTSVKKMILMK